MAKNMTYDAITIKAKFLKRKEHNKVNLKEKVESVKEDEVHFSSYSI